MRLGLGLRKKWHDSIQRRTVRREARAEQSAHAVDFSTLRTYAMFIGYPRSGHSLVGSLLDAHENMVIAHEADALTWVQQGLTREEVYHLLLRNAREFTESGREWSDYKYEVSGQFHGRWSQLRVIGDKKGQNTTRKLGSHPNLLGRARRLFGLPIRLIHVVRNPFDNISTIAAREETSLDAATDLYFHLHDTVAHTQFTTDPREWINIRHEDVIADPRNSVRKLVSFLGEIAPDAYVEACASIVFPSPNQSRRKAPWNPASILRVQKLIDDRPLLHGYNFDAI